MSANRSQQASLARLRVTRPSTAVHAEATFPIVGIGASSGGLDACERFLRALPVESGMAFILVQHLDPNHESLMAELLSTHTPMRVVQAVDGATIEKEHLYVIPPATYLSVRGGQLHLSLSRAGHGARLPFDHLLTSLAEECGSRAVCVVLSGNGADGSLGLKAVKRNLGLVIAQSPEEAAYDGMPRSAIQTGAVDLVLNVADIPQALIKYVRRMTALRAQESAQTDDEARIYVSEIIDLLREKTPLDFRPYKQGTLRRRIERRMALAKIEADGMERYLEVLRDDGGEVEQLAKDLLINVTCFFRDAAVFAFLAKEIVPELVRGHARNEPLRVWVAGCSTGEETYSLAMLFREEIAAQKSHIKLQLFASDVDSDAIAMAREGLYPATIEAEVSATRLARFFSREERGYRIQPDLRAMVVFALQDLMTDPPFSRLDFISCRNLLIYLRPEAQAKAIALFHFALRDKGILLLGSAETVGASDRHFKIIARPEKIYRHVGRSRPGELGFALTAPGLMRVPPRLEPFAAPSPQISYAELSRRMMLEAFTPVAVLVDRNLTCLHSSGPADRYLRVPSGVPTHDLLAVVRPELRDKLKTALLLAWHQRRKITANIGRVTDQNGTSFIHADLVPVLNDNEELMLICFRDRSGPEANGAPSGPPDDSRIEELELTLAASRLELQSALRHIELSSMEQTALNEETLSANEEYQSANEELLTSKEELQSLNEELTALNAQLQETLEKQRTAANDLQNVLYSTDVATLFLDTELKIRFFTPATKSLFHVIPSDIGRPLADLRSVAADLRLLEDAQTVLRSHGAIEREIEAVGGACYVRRILPYRTQMNGVEGVVITFIDITDRRDISQALESARQQAETANKTKSRFLAAASHDLRQPMQALSLIQGFLAKEVLGERAAKRVAQLGDALSAMTGMLNTLLDINEIESGTIHAEPVEFSIGALLTRLQEEFAYPAAAQGLGLRVVASQLRVTSDPRLLEQILRNLIANALKYTKKGRVLFGCRHRPGAVAIEIWDTGIGIAKEERLAIFDEYHQLDNAARERSHGLGLGLSIVRRLAKLLDHHISVRSWPGKGSVFSIEIKMPAKDTAFRDALERRGKEVAMDDTKHLGTILLVEDDPDLRELLKTTLAEEGHSILLAQDSVAAMTLLSGGSVRPDLILSDFNLPNGLNGLQLASALRAELGRHIPAIILTGDISTVTLHDIAVQNCLGLSKPAKLDDLTDAIQRLLQDKPVARPSPPKPINTDASVVFVVDDDSHLRAGIRALLENEGHLVEDFATCEAFLEAFRPGRRGCLLIDAYLPGMKGLELLQRLKEAGHHLPTIMITGRSDVPTAVQAMKSGASDFLEKPFDRVELLASIDRALEQSRDGSKLWAWQSEAVTRIAGLTSRQRQIMEMVLSGLPNKNIATDLSISQRTVEHHRAAIMEKTGSKSLPALARLALFAAQAKTPLQTNPA